MLCRQDVVHHHGVFGVYIQLGVFHFTLVLRCGCAYPLTEVASRTHILTVFSAYHLRSDVFAGINALK